MTRIVAAFSVMLVMLFLESGPLTQTLAGVAPQPAGSRLADDGLPSLAEFPPQDWHVSSLIRTGAVAKLAARRLKDEPANPGTIRLLAERQRVAEMLQALERLVADHPEHIEAAFAVLRDRMMPIQQDDTRGHKARLAEIVRKARERLTELPREDAARAERRLFAIDGDLSRPRIGRNEWVSNLRRFVAAYDGTEAAQLAEVDLIVADGVSLKLLDALDAFARAHPGTTAAARAVYERGFQLAVNVALTGLEKRGSDPTERFLQILDIVKELESGRYPRSEWVDRASTLPIQFFVSEPAYSPANLERVIAASYEFAKTHFSLDQNAGENGIGYFVNGKISALMKIQGDEIQGMERVFARLEEDVADRAGVRYLKAAYYLRGMRESQTERAKFLQKAIDTLSALQSEGDGPYHRKALATLSVLRFSERDCSGARRDFARYVQLYPTSEWAWVASLRMGLCDQQLGNANDAAAVHKAAADTYRANPVARVLARAYAARANEAQGEFQSALTNYQAALNAWDDDYGPAYSVHWTRPPKGMDFSLIVDDAEVRKQALPDRIAQLTQSLAQSGGAAFEQGRWLLKGERRQEAIAILGQFVARNPRSPLAPEARYLIHRARLEAALDLADVEKPEADRPAAIGALQNLGREPVDFATIAARIARASMLRQENPAEAERTMMQALVDWHAQQQMTKPATPLERDIHEIRNAVFLPQGGGVFASGNWNAFDWPRTPPPFAIVDPDVQVKLASGEMSQVKVKQAHQTTSKVLFLNKDELGLLRTMIVKLGGTKKRTPTAIMETPNQPIGGSREILALWNKFFPARPGHWGGWELETYPVIAQVEFIDAARTTAEARVTIGYSGATVVLVKEGGVWVAKRLINQWIT